MNESGNTGSKDELVNKNTKSKVDYDGSMRSIRPVVDLAPAVILDESKYYNYVDPAATEIKHNVKYNELYKPVIGPKDPYSNSLVMNKNVFTGAVEEYVLPKHVFGEMYNTYKNYGYAYSPDLSVVPYTGDVSSAYLNEGRTINSKRPVENDANVFLKRKKANDPADVENFMGPWAGYEEPPSSKETNNDETENDKELEINKNDVKPAVQKEPEEETEKTILHVKNERDYLNRTYLHAPVDLDVDLHAEPGIKECYLPKTLLHTYTGHNKAVSAIRLFPNTAHLLLSAGNDCKAKLWRVYNDRQCLRTFIGHTKGIKDITFNNSGKQFLTASYDKHIKLWDTETGQCITRITNRRIPYCIKFNPDPDKNHIFLAGCSDKRIYQYDLRTKEIVQEYDQHLGAVNTITFVDNNRRFVTTSDDKTLRAWEIDIPVVIKYVAEPSMHSMPAVVLHPKNKWLACQSLDNQIVIHSARDKFRCNRKKVFRGHLVAGYACEPGFSPDGRFISSGDGEGKLWFWDWKTCRVLKKFKAHDKVVIGHVWHPHETSKVFTCSWDGNIKLWD